MGMRAPVSFQEHFATLTDPRWPQAPHSRHRLMDILILAVCAVIGGPRAGKTAKSMARPKRSGSPLCWTGRMAFQGHDPFRRVLSRLDPEALTQCCIAWTQALSEVSGGAIVSSDGTTLRHSFAQATATAAIPMVRAWASANRLVLGQLKVDEKSNAITAIPAL